MKFNTHPEKLDRSVFIHRMYSKKHKKATQPQLGIWLWLFHCPRPSFLAPKTYSSADGPARVLLAQSMHVPGLAPGRSSRPTWPGWIHSTSWTRCWWWCCWKYWWWFRRRCWSSSQAERCHGIGCSCCCKRVRERKKIKMKSTLWTKFAKINTGYTISWSLPWFRRCARVTPEDDKLRGKWGSGSKGRKNDRKCRNTKKVLSCHPTLCFDGL